MSPSGQRSRARTSKPSGPSATGTECNGTEPTTSESNRTEPTRSEPRAAPALIPAPCRAAPAPEVVETLLAEAGAPGRYEVVEISSAGRTNTTTIITTGTQRWAVRVYGPSTDEGALAPADRAAKEAWLHPRLRAAGLPVPAIHAMTTTDGSGEATTASLVEFVPGLLLGSVARRVRPRALSPAWHDLGEALRRLHDLDPATALPGFGELMGGGVRPDPSGSYGIWLRRRLLRSVTEVQASVGPATTERLRATAEKLPHRLARRPMRLGHRDPHPWNVLVRPDGYGSWRLAALLDWETAWVADPAHDLMRVSHQRFAPIGPAPTAFWQGYGSSPDEDPELAAGMSAARLVYLADLHAARARGGHTPEISEALVRSPSLSELLDEL